MILFLATSLLHAAPGTGEVSNATMETMVGQYPPVIAVTTLDSREVNIADTIGKKMIVLNFFASWCPPCKRELPEFQKFYQEHSSEVLMLGLSLDYPKDMTTLETVIRENGITYPVALNKDKELPKKFGFKAIPFTAVIGADGKILDCQTKAIANPYEYFTQSLQKVAEQLKAGVAITKEQFVKQCQQDCTGCGGCK